MDATQAIRIGTQVRAARKARGWSQSDLAEAAGVAPNTVSAIEAGRNTRPGSLRSVLDALGIQPAAAGAAYVDEVELVRDLVGQWLTGLPPHERHDAAAALVRFVMTQRAPLPSLTEV